MRVRPWSRIFLLTIVLPVSLVLLIAATVIGSEAGRVWLAETGLSIAADRFQGQLQWQGVKSPQINHWRLDKLTIAGKDTGRIEAAGVDLRWQPLQLLHGRFILDALRFERISVASPPGGTGTKTTSATGTDISLLPVVIHSLSIDSLLLPLTVEIVVEHW